MSVELKDLTISYNRHPAVHHLSGTFPAQSLTAIVGPNGAGKSTLLKAIAGVLKLSTGEIVLNGITHEEIAYMPQVTDIDADFPLNVLQFVCTGYWRASHAFGGIDKAKREAAKFALARVGLSEFDNRPINTLSTGQFQRMLFARVIVQDAKLILLDEPFSAVDSETTSRLIDIVKTWNQEGRTIIAVLHDLEQVRKFFPQCLLLARKCISWGESNSVLTNDNLFSAKLFHEAWQDNAEVCQA